MASEKPIQIICMVHAIREICGQWQEKSNVFQFSQRLGELLKLDSLVPIEPALFDVLSDGVGDQVANGVPAGDAAPDCRRGDIDPGCGQDIILKLSDLLG